MPKTIAMNVNLTWRRKRKSLADNPRESIISADHTDHKWELYKAVMVASLSEGGGPADASRRVAWLSLKSLIRKNDPEFVAKLAIYMLEQMHSREISFLLSAALAVQPGQGAGVAALTERILQQPAWIAEWLEGYARVYQDHHGKTFNRPGRQLVKTLSPVFNRLDEFQYTRYDRRQQDQFRKALVLVKPAAKDRPQQALFGKILKDQLPARRGWQEELDAIRKQHDDSPALKRTALKNKWEALILSWKISYNDLLDQLPAILQAGVSGKALQLLAQYLGNAGAVAKNGRLAFRYLEAYRKVRSSGHHRTGPLLEAFEKAAILSAPNIGGFTADTRVLLAMDVSNSMKRAVEEDSSVDRFDIAPLLGMSLQYLCSRVTTGLFGNTWKPVSLPGKNMLGELDAFQAREGEVGYAANGYLVIGELIRKNLVTDKILLFTDCRLWNNRQPNQSPGMDIARLWRQYKQMAPHAQLYLFDLAAYGSSSVEVLPDDVYLVSGWNDRIFAVLKALEKSMCAVECIDFTISF